jgi:hypothetical protein
MLAEIASRTVEFNNLLAKHGIKKPQETTTAILGGSGTGLLDGEITEVRETWQKERVFKDRELIQDLVIEGFLSTNALGGVSRYIKQVTRRGEYEKRRAAIEQRIVGHLPREDWEKARQLVEASIFPRRMAEYGVVAENSVRLANAYQVFLRLPLAAVGSIPELVTPLIRAKGDVSLREFGKIVADFARNPREMRELAEDMGVIGATVGSITMAEIYTTSGDAGRVDRAQRAFFKWTGQDAVVDAARTIAVTVGQRYMLRMANNIRTNTDTETSLRGLNELGIENPQDIIDWAEAGMPVWGNTNSGLDAGTLDRVNRALSTFVTQGTLNPNSSEAPTWARHPLGALAWHLKSFMATFNKVVVGGVGREIGTRLDSGGDAKSAPGWIPGERRRMPWRWLLCSVPSWPWRC